MADQLGPTMLYDVTTVKRQPNQNTRVIEANIGGVLQHLTVTDEWYHDHEGN